MEGDYLELSQFSYNPHSFSYNSHQSPLGTIGFLTYTYKTKKKETDTKYWHAEDSKLAYIRNWINMSESNILWVRMKHETYTATTRD